MYVKKGYDRVLKFHVFAEHQNYRYMLANTSYSENSKVLRLVYMEFHILAHIF